MCIRDRIERERERESEHTLLKPISHPIFFLCEFARRQLLEPSELLEPSGATWSHLESSLAIWRCLDLSGAIWKHLEVSGPIWSHLELSGASWSHLGHVEPSGATWDHLDPSGAVLSDMDSSEGCQGGCHHMWLCGLVWLFPIRFNLTWCVRFDASWFVLSFEFIDFYLIVFLSTFVGLMMVDSIPCDRVVFNSIWGGSSWFNLLLIGPSSFGLVW